MTDYKALMTGLKKTDWRSHAEPVVSGTEVRWAVTALLTNSEGLTTRSTFEPASDDERETFIFAELIKARSGYSDVQVLKQTVTTEVALPALTIGKE